MSAQVKDPLKIRKSNKNLIKPVARVDRFDLGRAVKMRFEQRMSYSEIGALLGVSAQAVQSRISTVCELLGDREKIKEFQARESDVLANAREVLITSALEPGKINKAPVQSLVWSYGVLFDKQRLLDGKSTQNIAYQDMTASEAEVEARIKAIAEGMGIDPATTTYSVDPTIEGEKADIPGDATPQALDNM